MKAKAEISRQLMVKVKDSIGTLAEITGAISSSNINQIAICAYAIGDDVALMFVTEDNNAARKLLEEKGYVVEEEEVVLLSMSNEPGALQTITDKIAEAGIDLQFLYGSVSDNSPMSRLVLLADNNMDVVLLIKTEFERNE